MKTILIVEGEREGEPFRRLSFSFRRFPQRILAMMKGAAGNDESLKRDFDLGLSSRLPRYPQPCGLGGEGGEESFLPIGTKFRGKLSIRQ